MTKIGGTTIEDLKKSCIRSVDVAAELFRSEFITAGAGQISVYQQKLKEAEAVIAHSWDNSDLQLAETPMLATEAELRGISKTALAIIIVSKAQEWAETSAGIELARIGAKRAIEAAATPQAVRAASVVDWKGIVA